MSGYTRRDLLAGAAALPFFGGLMSRIAGAQEGLHPLRLVLMFTGNGQHPDHWLPTSTGDEAQFTLSPVLEPLAAHKDKLLLLHELAGEGTHSGGMSEATTGRPSRTGDGIPTGGPSIDQLFADRWRGSTPLPSLEVGVRPANDPYDHICYSARGLAIPPIGSPLGAYRKVFGVTNEDPRIAITRRAQNASVLDTIAGDLARITARIDAPSRRLLDEHLTLVREKEVELSGPYTPLQCDLHEAPTGESLVDTWRHHNDTIVSALRCGTTRVATLRAGGWGGIESGGYEEIGVNDGHHSVAHGTSNDPHRDLAAINRWHAEQLAYLIQSLDAVPEGGGTLLDHTVVVWLNELGLGDFNHHSRRDVHVVLAGGSAAGLKNGAFLSMGGANYHHFLFTLARALGANDLAGFGDHGDRILAGMMA